MHRLLRCLTGMILLAVVALQPAVAPAATADSYTETFRRALAADASRAAVTARLGSPQNRDLYAAQERERQISRLSSIAAEGVSLRPGDLEAVLTGLRQGAPEHAAAVGDRLRTSFPGFAPQIMARVGTAQPAAALAPAAPQQSFSLPALPPRPSRQASQAAATAIARIAGNPSVLSQAVAEAVAAAPGEAPAVGNAIAQAFPGFASQVYAAAGVAPGSAQTALAVTPLSPSPAGIGGTDGEPLALEPAEDFGPPPDSDDPIEPFNRAVFTVNDVIDTALLRPIALGYRTITPDPVIVGVRRFFLNLNSPVIFANDVLQTDFNDAGVTLGRFAVNSTVGVLGFFDPATSFGLARHSADFGQTLHSYGVPDGAYLVLPLFGPSNVRDTVGKVVDTVTDPLFWILDDVPSLILSGVETVSGREELLDPLDELKASSVDYYSAVKSAYKQNRRVQLNKGRPLPGGSADYDRLFDETLPTLDE